MVERREVERREVERRGPEAGGGEKWESTNPSVPLP